MNFVCPPIMNLSSSLGLAGFSSREKIKHSEILDFRPYKDVLRFVEQ